MLQVEALEIMKTGANIFLTGVPGAGKTYVVNKYVDWLRDKGIWPAITASTGIAATHIGGSTIHSFSGIGIEKNLDEYKIEKIMEREKLVKKIQNTNVLIVDEISMLDAGTLDNVNKVLKAIKDPTKAFGGVQVIFVGDFFQLPPVTRRGEETKYFAFHSLAWKESRPLTCYLEEQFRQTDEVFTRLLLAIRENNIDEMYVEILEDLKKKTFKKLGLKEEKKNAEGEWEEAEVIVLEEKKPLPSLKKEGKVPKEQETLIDVLELHSHNKNVDEINDRKLNLIPEKEFTYTMETFGKFSIVEGLMKSCLSPEILKLKVGAKVIFTKNDLEGKFVNGTMGMVKDLDEATIVIETKSGKLIEVKKEEWKLEDDGKVKARIMQYPLRLAWAITVHKSQGMSLDEAIISLGDTFEYGQGYVALSRVRSLEGLYLKSYNPKSLRVNEAISEFDEKIRKDSRFIQDKFELADKKKLQKTQNIFIEKCGGKVEGGVKKAEAGGGWGEPKKETQIITLEMLNEDKTMEEIAALRDISVKTIYKHLEILFKEKKLSKLDISKICKKSEILKNIDIFNIPGDVKKSFKENMRTRDEEGNIKLAPIFKDLNEKYSYEYLRLYRIFI